jgi:hypothetical protein
VALELLFLRALISTSVNVIPPTLHSYILFVCDRWYVRFATYTFKVLDFHSGVAVCLKGKAL